MGEKKLPLVKAHSLQPPLQCLSECKNTSSPGEGILDRQACYDIIHSELHSDEEKPDILQKNCLSLLQAVPFNFELATFCFSHSKFFQLKKEDNTLGLMRQHFFLTFSTTSLRRSYLNTMCNLLVCCCSAKSVSAFSYICKICLTFNKQ